MKLSIAFFAILLGVTDTEASAAVQNNKASNDNNVKGVRGGNFHSETDIEKYVQVSIVPTYRRRRNRVIFISLTFLLVSIMN